MDIIMEAYRSTGDSLRFGHVDLFEAITLTHTYQYLLDREHTLLMTITIIHGQGIYWNVEDNIFRNKMEASHSDRWDQRFEFSPPLFGEARLVKNYMFKQLDSSIVRTVEEYSICYVDSSGSLRSSSIIDAELDELVTLSQLKELGY